MIAKIEAGEDVTPGTQQKGRIHGAPADGPVTLTDPSLYDGSRVKYGLGKDMGNDVGAGDVEPSAKIEKEDQKPVKAAKPTSAPTKTSPPKSSPEPAVKTPAEHSGDAPELLKAPMDGKADNLKEISGIGPKIEEKLNAMGVFHFSQIASWSEENCAFVNSQLSFKGRIEREDWIAQAKVLAEGGDTAFSKRVAAGKVDSSKSEGDK